MPIFILSAAKTMHMLSYFAPKYFNFHLQPSRCEKFSPGEKPSDPWIEREREGKGKGLKGSYL